MDVPTTNAGLQPQVAPSVALSLMPFTVAVFLGFLAIGIPLPVLPGQIGHVLGFGTITVGTVVGIQSFATLFTRQFAGRLSDARGPKRAALLGFAAAALAGLCYLVSSVVTAAPALSLGVLIGGRLLLGLGESLFITALAAWSIVRVGAANAGRAMAWQGMAMYGALAVGAPLGGLIERVGGFQAVSACVILFPLIGALMVTRWARVAPAGGHRVSSLQVLRAIWVPGVGLALASSGFGTIAAFLALRYQAAGWSNPGAALTCFGVAYILMRVLFGGLPDRIGGYKIAMFSLVVEAAGQILLSQASSPGMAFAGSAVTAIGYSLVFPSLGVEAMKRVAPEHRGTVIGAYLACFDLGLAAAGPVSGAAAQLFGLNAAFIAGATASALSVLLIAVFRARGDAAPGFNRR